MNDDVNRGDTWQGLKVPLHDTVHPKLRWYDPGIPIDIVVPDVPLPEFLRRAANRVPDRPAIRFRGTSVSFASLEEAVTRFANSLRALGLEPGDRVGLLLPNCPQMVVATYGALRAGAIAVPTNPQSSPEALIHLWKRAGVRIAVTLSPTYPRVAEARTRIPGLQHLVVADLKEYLPSIRTRIRFSLSREGQEGRGVRLPRDGKTHTYADLLLSGSDRDPRVRIDPHSLALLQPSGDTTGQPRLAMLTHHNLSANAHQLLAWVQPVAQPNGADVVLGALPMHHSYGMTAVLNFSMVNGSTMVLESQFTVPDAVADISRERVTFFPGIPSMYTAFTAARGVKRSGLKSLTAAISEAAPLPEEVQAEFERLTGVRLVEGYGLAEAGPLTHSNPMRNRRKPGSIGLPLPGTDAAIFDAETRTKLLPPGEVGELAVRGPQIMRGYWNDPRATAEALYDDWLFTGDLATVDGDGYFSIVGRTRSRQSVGSAGQADESPPAQSAVLGQDEPQPVVDPAESANRD
jgi:long-chain acyl-CoA synthetase